MKDNNDKDKGNFIKKIGGFLKQHILNIILVIILIIAVLFLREITPIWVYWICGFLLIRKIIIWFIRLLTRIVFNDAKFEYDESEKFGNGLFVVVLVFTTITAIIINLIDLTKQISTLSMFLTVLNIILISAIDTIYGMYMVDNQGKEEDSKEYKKDLRSIKVFGMISMIVIVLFVTLVFSIETSDSNYSKQITFEKNPISKKQAEKEGQYMKLDNGKYYKVHVQSK